MSLSGEVLKRSTGHLCFNSKVLSALFQINLERERVGKRKRESERERERERTTRDRERQR